MNRRLKISIAKFLFHAGFYNFVKYISGRKHIILTFHRVRKSNIPFNAFDTCPNVDVDIFHSILTYVKNNYSITTLKDLCENLESKRKLAAITFDDGWRDNYEIAYPILKEMDLPGTIFVTTGKINSYVPFWQQRLGECFRRYLKEMNENDRTGFKIKLCIKANEPVNHDMYRKIVEDFKTYPFLEIKNKISSIAEAEENTSRIFLSEEEIYKMSKGKIDFGSHTVNHAILTKETEETVDEELLKSKKKLEKIINKPVDMIAYPNGNYSNMAVRKAKYFGYKYGVTTTRGCVSPKNELMALPRIDSAWDNLNDLSGKFSKYMFQWEIR